MYYQTCNLAKSAELRDSHLKLQLSVAQKAKWCSILSLSQKTDCKFENLSILYCCKLDVSCNNMYVKIETSRLDYFKNHQREIRADLYQGIVDSVNKGETQASNIGTRIILPGSFVGGPRDMRKRYLDAMALVGKYGKPDLFITMTCNPNWKEIKQELKKREEAQNRPDLLTRIFKSKFQELRKDVIKKELFRPVATYTFVIEFQKRELPHVHMLLILKDKYKLVSTDQFDGIISAELPDKEAYPHLSFDETEDKSQEGLYIDFLNSVTPTGMPPHRLLLKENSPILMLRNINPSKGLCNGTRLICRHFTPNIIIAEISEPVFSHGQLYVALSRATTATKVKVHRRETKTNRLEKRRPRRLFTP